MARRHTGIARTLCDVRKAAWDTQRVLGDLIPIVSLDGGAILRRLVRKQLLRVELQATGRGPWWQMGALLLRGLLGLNNRR